MLTKKWTCSNFLSCTFHDCNVIQCEILQSIKPVWKQCKKNPQKQVNEPKHTNTHLLMCYTAAVVRLLWLRDSTLSDSGVGLLPFEMNNLWLQKFTSTETAYCKLCSFCYARIWHNSKRCFTGIDFFFLPRNDLNVTLFKPTVSTAQFTTAASILVFSCQWGRGLKMNVKLKDVNIFHL